MELILIELFLWAGLIFFFWALRDSLGQVETEIESLGLFDLRQPPSSGKRWEYVLADHVREPIGTYKDVPIYRYVVIDNDLYEFDYICPFEEGAMILQKCQRCVAPGMVYTHCGETSVSMD
jgi:hypothetical protein